MITVGSKARRSSLENRFQRDQVASSERGLESAVRGEWSKGFGRKRESSNRISEGDCGSRRADWIPLDLEVLRGGGVDAVWLDFTRSVISRGAQEE